MLSNSQQKRCARCQEKKPLSDFTTDRSRKDNLNKYCRPCHGLVRRETYWKNPDAQRRAALAWNQAHPERAKASHKRWVQAHWEDGGRERQYLANIRWRHGLSKEAFDALVLAQQGQCALCSQVKRLCVDHSHLTGKIRGLLCVRCNAALGQLIGDDPANVDRVYQYLLLGV